MTEGVRRPERSSFPRPGRSPHTVRTPGVPVDNRPRNCPGLVALAARPGVGRTPVIVRQAHSPSAGAGADLASLETGLPGQPVPAIPFDGPIIAIGARLEEGARSTSSTRGDPLPPVVGWRSADHVVQRPGAAKTDRQPDEVSVETFHPRLFFAAPPVARHTNQLDRKRSQHRLTSRGAHTSPPSLPTWMSPSFLVLTMSRLTTGCCANSSSDMNKTSASRLMS